MGQQGSQRAINGWPYALQYEDGLREGHSKPAPSCGSPTILRHIAVWPKQPFGDQRVTTYKEACDAYDEENARFFEEVSAFAEGLQKLGRIGEPERLAVDRPPLRGQWAEETHGFMVCRPQAIAFTLWWRDEAGLQVQNKAPDGAGPIRSDMRVRVLLQTHRDHATISIFIDVAKLFGQAQIDDAEVFTRSNDYGRRRLRVMESVNLIRHISGEQIRKGYVELSRIPENGVTPERAQRLLDAADFLYDGIWREFDAAFGIDDAGGGAKACGERFADFRGVVMSVRGLDATSRSANPSEHDWDYDGARVLVQDRLRRTNAPDRDEKVVRYTSRVPGEDVPSFVSGTIGLGTLTKFDDAIGESNTVLKSLWPFMRRMTPWADYCDWVGCGIAGGRALYITALGSEASAAADEEADRLKDVPSASLPELRPQPDATSGRVTARPLRYLIVTKGEPLREQIGRYVERINSIGTMRLFALRNMAAIRNASVHIEVLGRLLDGTLQDWERNRSVIDDDFRTERRLAKEKVLGRRPSFGEEFEENERDIEKVLRSDRIQRIETRHIRRLSAMIQHTEGRLINIGGKLDEIGEGGSGRMLYVIARANYFAAEFDRMYPTLAIRDVDGWINYKNFVDRGMRPAFEFIAATGERLKSIRTRLQTVTETIQTAALIVETEATRENTAALGRIARSFWLRLGGTGIFFIAVRQMLGPVWDKFVEYLLQRYLDNFLHFH